ncbi:ribonuclease H1-like isoform X2 [Ornithodoros turicata]|uniref:ribonuclease H1-like isoform X2 n=1 Tax=Ornithodoros turicata TaxID=34597 RepID=UPI0031393815
MGKFFYAVRRGRNTGVYDTWAECEAQVKGFPFARYKKFETQEEALAFVTDNEPITLQNDHGGTSTHVVAKAPFLQQKRRRNKRKHGFESSNAQAAQNHGVPGEGHQQGAGINQRQSVTLQAGRKRQQEGESVTCQVPSKRVCIDLTSDDDMLHVYTDGACTANGKKGAKAGIGVYWGHNHPMNVSERISGRQTNNRAEIQAAVKAMQQAKSMGGCNLTIYTDSQFMIQSVTSWMPAWVKNNWQLSNGGPVKNKEDFQDLLRAAEGLNVKWVHVRGHRGIEGNERADQLATSSLKLPLPQASKAKSFHFQTSSLKHPFPQAPKALRVQILCDQSFPLTADEVIPPSGHKHSSSILPINNHVSRKRYPCTCNVSQA